MTTAHRGRILAMGGGGFTMDDPSHALDAFVLSLTGKPVPKVCFLPTASGDPRDQVTRFYERFGSWPCEPSILSLFHLARDRIDPVAHLLAQDAIYVGGGQIVHARHPGPGGQVQYSSMYGYDTPYGAVRPG